MVDARGLSCPMPVLLVQKAIKSNENRYEVLIDDVTPRENVKRFAESQGFTVEIEENDDEYKLILTR